MTAEKHLSISFRVSTRFKDLLEAAAAREHRSQTNMIETLLFDYCEQNHIAPNRAEESIKIPARSKPHPGK